MLYIFDGNDKLNIFDIILHYFDTFYQLITFIIFVCMWAHAHTELKVRIISTGSIVAGHAWNFRTVGIPFCVFSYVLWDSHPEISEV